MQAHREPSYASVRAADVDPDDGVDARKTHRNCGTMWNFSRVDDATRVDATRLG